MPRGVRSSSRRCGTTASSRTSARAPRKRPALYELKDGEPALVAFDLTEDGLYVARHVVGDGWLQIGDERLRTGGSSPRRRSGEPLEAVDQGAEGRTARRDRHQGRGSR